MNTAGLSIDQAPPLAVPLAFYALMPIALVAAGGLLALQGNVLFATNWLPQTIAWTHLVTLGALLPAMLGSLYQMVPVVLGTPVPAIRLAFAVAAALAVGTSSFVLGLLVGIGWLVQLGAVALAVALVCFLLPVGLALARAQGGGPTRTGMRGAFLCLLALAMVGLRLAWGHATGTLPQARQVWLTVHIALALLGWIGGLTMAVSWQVVPMFYLTQPFPPRLTRVLALALPGSALLVALAGLADLPLPQVLLTALPAALVIWLLQPAVLAHQIRGRRRRRSDPTLQFWWLGLACAPLVLLAAVLTWTTDWPPAPLLFGWLALVGWAGATIHGMLTRIAPFLVWFHAFSTRDSRTDVPPMRRLLPDKQVRWNLGLHALTLVCGVGAIASGNDAAARVTGVLLTVTGVLLGAALLGTVRRARPQRVAS